MMMSRVMHRMHMHVRSTRPACSSALHALQLATGYIHVLIYYTAF